MILFFGASSDLFTILSHSVPLLLSLYFNLFNLPRIPQFDDSINSEIRRAYSNDRANQREQKIKDGFVGNVFSFECSLESCGWKGTSLQLLIC